ncbi:Hsp20/alpha crystallin family protein [Candidatus Burarchaeum australiense]|nr:Hsp20/alpha crystallin family protein [Candidatus Burarchaeum australiense]
MFPRRKRGFGFFDMDDDFGHMQDIMEKMMQEAMRNMESGKPSEGSPFVRGFSLRIGPDGKPVFEEFGNVVKKKEKGAEQAEEREPLIDIMNRKDEITVIAEVPGAEKHEIKTSLSKDRDVLYITVDNPQRKYKKAVRLPERVRSDGAAATYKNGVLEVRLKKEEPGKADKGQDIRVQ